MILTARATRGILILRREAGGGSQSCCVAPTISVASFSSRAAKDFNFAWSKSDSWCARGNSLRAAQGRSSRGFRRTSFDSRESRPRVVAMGEVAEPGKKEEELALFQPLQFGPLFKLNHRVVLAPLTRCRSYGHVPQPHAAIYYAQRATPGGLLITEATAVNATGDGYPETPGIWKPKEVEAWKPIVKAVKDKGAIFFTQLWHVGRTSHTSYQPHGAKPISSTNRRIKTGTVFAVDGSGSQPYSEPRALETDEIPIIVQDFAHSAKNAISAGFDGVEIHGAHGYLLDQFMKSGINDRTDKYGGSLENRCRFVLEIVDALVEAIGKDRVGIRLSPFAASLGEAFDEDPQALGLYMAQELEKRKILYVHYVQPRWNAIQPQDVIHGHSLEPFRKAFSGVFFGAGGYERETAEDDVKSGLIDAAVFGRLFLANPDLPRRYKLNAPLNKYDRSTFYTQDPVKGYTDYPFLEESNPELVKAAA